MNTMDKIMPWLDKEYFHPHHERHKENVKKNNQTNDIIASLGMEFKPCGTHDSNSNSKHKRPMNVSHIDDNDDNNDNDYGGMTIIKNNTQRQAISSNTHIEGSVVVPAPNLRPYINGANKLLQKKNVFIKPSNNSTDIQLQNQLIKDSRQKEDSNIINKLLQRQPIHQQIKPNHVSNNNTRNNVNNNNNNARNISNLGMNLNEQPHRIIRMVGGHLVDQTNLQRNQEKSNNKQNTITTQKQEIERKKLQDKRRNDEIATLLGKRSTHEVDAENEIWKKQEERFDKLIKMEYAQAKNESIESIKVQSYCCSVCRITTEKYPELCKKNNHHIDTLQVLKRFFECTNAKCQKRTSTMNEIYPKYKCECGLYSWKKCGKNSNDYGKLSVGVEDLNKLTHI